ncbi:nicotinate phosphoribosyltransferase, partial [Vibrio cholerae CP1035(8)]
WGIKLWLMSAIHNKWR